MLSDQLTRPAPGWLAPGTRVYAVGDVHGCDRRLAALHRLVAKDLARAPAASPLLLHLGDYVDRGPASAAVVRRLAAGNPLPGIPTISLRGNHEQMMLDALDGDPEAVELWLGNGGDATLRSWGVSPHGAPASWRAAMAPELPFLHTLPFHHALDGYVFVHAGLRPGVPLARQSEHDLLWIREDFLHWPGKLLPEAPQTAAVHGHTPGPVPVVAGQRIGIDTGAVAGGKLTCAVLEGSTVRFLAA